MATGEERIAALAVAVTLIGVGLFRLAGADLDFSVMDKDQVREYFFHAAAGLYFGWSLLIGIGGVLNRPAGERAELPFILATMSPVIVLALAHQTRDTIDDGPITLCMGVGFLLAYMASGRNGSPDKE